jgi:hypothetical protein
MWTFVPFLAVGVIWMLAQPIYSGADEGQHAVEFEAVWSGQFTPPLDPHITSQIESGLVRVPDMLSSGEDCFFNQKGVSAKCETTALRVRPPTEEVPTYLGREPPLPSILTGLPIFLAPDRTGFYLSRFLTALIGSALFATAVALALSRRRVLLVIGVLVAATPSVIAEWGVLGSSQLEIGAALILWVCVALVASGEEVTSPLSICLFGSFAALVLSRPISFLYAAFAILALLLAGGRPRLHRLLAVRWGRAMAVIAVAAFVGSLLWFFAVEAPTNPDYMRLAHLPVINGVSQRVSFSLGYVPLFWSQMIGATGNNEYFGPGWLTSLWTMLAGGCFGLGVLLGHRRQAATVAGLLAALLFTSVAAQSYYLPQISLTWMGRYDLPTFAGVVVLGAGFAGKRLGAVYLPRLVAVGVAAVASLQILEFAGTLRRYVVGTNGPLDPLSWGNGWHPPVDATVLLAAGCVVLALAYAAIFRLCHALLTLPDGGYDNERALATSSMNLSASP